MGSRAEGRKVCSTESLPPHSPSPGAAAHFVPHSKTPKHPQLLLGVVSAHTGNEPHMLSPIAKRLNSLSNLELLGCPAGHGLVLTSLHKHQPRTQHILKGLPAEGGI